LVDGKAREDSAEVDIVISGLVGLLAPRTRKARFTSSLARNHYATQRKVLGRHTERYY